MDRGLAGRAVGHPCAQVVQVRSSTNVEDLVQFPTQAIEGLPHEGVVPGRREEQPDSGLPRSCWKSRTYEESSCDCCPTMSVGGCETSADVPRASRASGGQSASATPCADDLAVTALRVVPDRVLRLVSDVEGVSRLPTRVDVAKNILHLFVSRRGNDVLGSRRKRVAEQ